MDTLADAAPRAPGAPAKWNVHTMVVASGASAIEGTSCTELLTALARDAELSAPSHHHSSYQIVRRREVEETVRRMRIAAVRAERAADSEATDHAESPVNDHNSVAEEEIDVGVVTMTPTAMALAFQRLVALDKQAWVDQVASSDATPQAPAPATVARVFLLVDYPSSVAEAHVLLLTGESGETKPHQSAPNIPLLPLLDGVLLVVDPMRELRERRKSVSLTDERRKSVSLTDERRKSVTRRISTEGKDAAELVDKPRAVASCFQTANPLVRDLYGAAAVGGLEWTDVEFLDLACCTSVNDVKPVTELVRDLETAVATRVAHKAVFKDWVSSIKTTALPAMDATGETAQVLASAYEQRLRGVFAPSVTVASVVWAMREAVVSAAGENSGDDASDNNNAPAPAPEAFIEYGDDAALAIALSYDAFTKETDRHDCDPCYLSGERIDALEKRMWRSSDLPGVGNRGRKGMPVQSRLTDAERSVLDTEFASFATVPVPRVHLVRQLLRLEELLGQPWKGKLHSRNVAEFLSADVLPQRLASILRDSPTVIKEYDASTDSLLVAAINTTAPGRFRTTAWTARDHVRHRPALKDWHRETLPSDEYLTPRTALAAMACVPLSAGELTAVAEKCSIAYPADQSMIKLYQTPHAPAWVTVSLDGDVLGLRPSTEAANEKLFAMQFYANFVDDSQLLIRDGRKQPKKPDGHATIVATLTSPDGLVFTASSDGTIVLHPTAGTIVLHPTAGTESYRVISGKGTVVSVLADGSRRILLPNGDIFTGSEDTTLEMAMRELTVDPETNAVIEHCVATGVIVVTLTDGARVTYHADGTTMYSTPTRSHILVTKPGLPDVCIDVDVNLAAQRHANGEKVAVTKGGLRSRSIVRLVDGTQVLLQYNTKVVAEVNGRIVIEKVDGTNIVAKDSGRVEFTSRGTKRTESDDDADRDELRHNCVYYFNCLDGHVSLVDHEQNHFSVDVGDGRGLPTVNVDLAGVLSETDADKYDVAPIPARAMINDPIEPFVFVLHGDGTGRELLRPRDVHALSTGAFVDVSSLTPPSLMSNDWWSQPLQSSLWTVERTFVQEIRPDPRRALVARRPWFNDEKLTACFDRLKTPVTTALCLVAEPCLPPPSTPDNQITIVRHVEQLRSMTSDDVNAMLTTTDNWRQWQREREANKDRFKVVDPRDADVHAQEAAMQRKVMVAYKATRARKKAERQKQLELQRKSRADPTAGSAHMETVQEGNEPQDGDQDDFDQMFSDGTDEDSHSDLDVEVDDPDELMWTAFSRADTGDSGRVTLAQARQALVHVLGVGVTSAEVTQQLRAFKQPEPFAIPFDVFVDLVHAFRDPHGDNREEHDNNALSDTPNNKPLAAGSATEAVRSFSLLRLNPSSSTSQM